nr:hypothetical protein [Candidatus Freyarchaeota archaeon]
MPLGIFVISFLDESVSLDFSIFHTSDVTEEDIRHIFSGMEIEKGTIQHLFTSSLKILYYAIVRNEKESLLGMVLHLKEEPDLFETPLREEAELLLQKDREENFSINLKASYQRIVQKAVKNIEEIIAKMDKKEKEEKSRNIKNLEEELKKFYNEEKELLAKLEREGETSSIIEKMEAVIAKQKQLEELIRMQKNLKAPMELPKEKYSDLRNELIELQELYNQINEFTVVQSSIEPEEAIKEEIEEKELKPTEKAASNSEISDLMKRLQTLSSKQLTSQSKLVSSESSKALEPETTTMYNKKIASLTEAPSSKISVLESESEETRLSRILTEKFGESKGVILEYLFWLKKPRTITEISQDLEIPAEKIIEPAEDLAKNGYICEMTKKNVKEIYLTVCPSCPLQHKCGKKRPIDWNQILSKT